MSLENNSSPYAVLKLADFRLVLAARLLTTISVQIQGMAVGWQIFALTHHPLALGFIGLAEVVPAVGVALFAGHLADIVNRRYIAAGATFVLTLCTTALWFCSVNIQNQSQLAGMIYFLIAITGFARGFYGPAVFGIISDIVPRELLGNAAAWNSACWQFSAMAGPVIGGALYLKFGAAHTYLASVLFLVASLLMFMVAKSSTKIEKSARSPLGESIKEGLRFVFSNQIMLGAMTLDLFAVLFGGAVALLPIFVSDVFHRGPDALGMLRAAPCIGALITSTYLTHKPITKRAGSILMIAVAGFGFCMVLFGMTTNFYVAMALLAVSGALDGISVYVRNTIFQLATPNDMKGRVSAVNNIFIGSSNELGEFESGVAANFLGLVRSVIFGGCMTMLVVAATAFKAPLLRKLDMNELYKDEKVAPAEAKSA